MSNLRLNITDQNQTIHDTVHLYFVEALLAALTAEPETIEELGLALARFIKPPENRSPFSEFKNGKNLDPYDTGVALIDLASRVIVVDPIQFEGQGEGSIHVQSEFAEEDVYVPYRLSGDWLFVPSIAEYESAVKGRREGRLAPFDAREILFGRALSEFIAGECLESSGSQDEQLFTKIHAKWLTFPREDLRGMTPREVLLEKKDFIDFELHSRELQWSFTKECPPPLSPTSTAYHFSGFGTHEIVLCYELFRYLLDECFENSTQPFSLVEQSERLEQLKSTWLNSPGEDCYGRTPSQVIELERRRVNMTLSAKESIIDEDCDCCQWAAMQFDSPMFWHLDGCNMDEDFEFSFHKTRDEFDEEERQRIEFNRQFDIDYKAGKYDKPIDEWPIDSDTDSLF